MMKNFLRVIPIKLSEEQRALRRAYVLKLSGLPRGTLPRDLLLILNEIKAKSCVINRNPRNYQPLNYAFLSFPSEHHIADAITREFAIKSKPLFWSLSDSKMCNICGIHETEIKFQKVRSK